MGAPVGNKNAAKAKEFEGALRRALLQYEQNGVKRGEALRAVADRLVQSALDGEAWAISAIADRLDGKPTSEVKQDVNVNHSGSIEHRGVQETSARLAELLGGGPLEHQSPPVSH